MASQDSTQSSPAEYKLVYYPCRSNQAHRQYYAIPLNREAQRPPSLLVRQRLLDFLSLQKSVIAELKVDDWKTEDGKVTFHTTLHCLFVTEEEGAQDTDFGFPPWSVTDHHIYTRVAHLWFDQESLWLAPAVRETPCGDHPLGGRSIVWVLTYYPCKSNRQVKLYHLQTELESERPGIPDWDEPIEFLEQSLSAESITLEVGRRQGRGYRLKSEWDSSLVHDHEEFGFPYWKRGNHNIYIRRFEFNPEERHPFKWLGLAMVAGRCEKHL